MSELSVSNLVSVDVLLSNIPAQAQSLQNLLIIGNSQTITKEEGIRRYSSLTDIATEFSINSDEYKAATLWFAQNPQPKEILLANSNSTAASSAKLIGSNLTSSQTLLSNWTSVTAGYFTVTIDGVVRNISGVDLSAATSLTQVAAIITTALQAGTDPSGTMTWNSATKKFTLVSDTTGPTSTLTKLTATVGGTGTDLASKLLMHEAAANELLAQGSAMVTLLDTVVDLEDRFGQTWYALYIPSATDNDHLEIAAFIEASANKHAYCVNSSDANILATLNTTNIAYKLKELAFKKTLVQYSNTPHAVVSLVARILTTDYTAYNTAITLMYKDEPNVVPESLSQTQMNNLLGYNCNVFVKYNNNTSIIQPGKVSSGEFIDSIFGADWLAVTIQNSIYNVLYTNLTKIPQTNEGNNIIKGAIVFVLNQAVNSGLLAKGLVWNQDGVGDVKRGDVLNSGYYVYVPDINDQSPEDRALRKSVPIKVLAQLAGAIHSVDVVVAVSR